jgi:hypothetical protein
MKDDLLSLYIKMHMLFFQYHHTILLCMQGNAALSVAGLPVQVLPHTQLHSFIHLTHLSLMSTRNWSLLSGLHHMG